MIVFILLRGDDRVHPALAIQLRSHLTYCLGRAEGSDISLIHPTATAAGTRSLRLLPIAYRRLYPDPTAIFRALNSAVECHLHTVEVIGSNPIAPTISLSCSLSSLCIAGMLCEYCILSASPLSDGIVSGNSVVCPLHAWKLDLEDGRVQRPAEARAPGGHGVHAS